MQQGISVPSYTFYDTIYYWYVSTLKTFRLPAFIDLNDVVIFLNIFLMVYCMVFNSGLDLVTQELPVVVTSTQL